MTWLSPDAVRDENDGATDEDQPSRDGLSHSTYNQMGAPPMMHIEDYFAQ